MKFTMKDGAGENMYFQLQQSRGFTLLQELLLEGSLVEPVMQTDPELSVLGPNLEIIY